MKNLLGKNEFAKLKKLDSYDKLYEDMDFSFSNNQYDRLSVLLPYINKYPEIKLNVQKKKFQRRSNNTS